MLKLCTVRLFPPLAGKLYRLRCVPIPSADSHKPVQFSVLVPRHAGADRRPAQDGGMWDWFAPPGGPGGGDTAAADEVTRPRRLVQQIESEEETAHRHLDTRVKNSTADTLVSYFHILWPWGPGTPRGP